jgi:hypothetical protein
MLLFTAPFNAQQGLIDGKAAVMALPAGGAKSLSPRGCNAFYAPATAPEKPIIVPCGTWTVIPSNQYLIWVEQDGAISRTPVSRAIDAGARQGSITLHEMTGAGFIAAEALAQDDVHVRYIHFSSASHGFTRTRMGSASTTAVAMPAGHIGGGRFDSRTGRAIALFHSMDVPAGQSRVVAPRAPQAGTSDVFAELAAPANRKLSLDEIDLAIDGKLVPADDFVDGGDRLYAIWYAVRGESAKVVVPRGDLWYYGEALPLAAGRVATVRGDLRPKPSLEVVAHVQSDKMPEMFVDVQRLGDSNPLNHVAIRNNEQTRIESLTPGSYDVFLRLSRWKLRKRIEVSDGRDGVLDFEVTPIYIQGVVRHGHDPAPAKISFQDYDGWIDVDTDDDGSYHATLWTPRDYLTRVSLRSDPADFIELKRIYESGQIDFDLPRTQYTVRVRSAADHRPLQGAKVIFENAWSSDAGGPQNIFLNVMTNEAGEARLPPLRQGRLAVKAEAKGFKPSDFRRDVVQSEGEHLIDIALEPNTQSAALRLTLPNGAPAAGAELLALPQTGDGVLWRGTAGDDGAVDVPDFVIGALLLARHASGASIARVWSGKEQEWAIPVPAPPLVVRVESSSPPRGDRVTLFVDGLRLSGASLAFVTWSSPVVGLDGMWTARNLPQTSVRILVSRRADPNAIAAGAYDALATQCAFPWLQPIVIREAN